VLVRDMVAASVADIASKLKGSALEPQAPVAGEPLALTKPELPVTPGPQEPSAGVVPADVVVPETAPRSSGARGPGGQPALAAAYRSRLREAMRELPAIEEAA
jgi:hypothetical protein